MAEKSAVDARYFNVYSTSMMMMRTVLLLAATTCCCCTLVAGSNSAWSTLRVSLPTPLSDMGIVALESSSDDSKKRIIITGGCDSPLGNEYIESGMNSWFECSSLSNKVCYLCYKL